MPHRNSTDSHLSILTPADGMVLPVAVSGLLWSGMVVTVHLAGVL